MHIRTFAAAALFAVAPLSLYAQSDMPGMSMPTPRTLIGAELDHSSSGTSIEPPSTPTPMLMRQAGNWTLMLHANVFVADTQQHADSGRGGDKLFSTNWIMPMAQRGLGPAHGVLTLRTMLSLEPATITGRFFPELFQQGETAYGRPIVDGQHPHDFFMELDALYDVHPTENLLLSFYVAPIGDPAIGPTAYPHRLSASEDPIAALGHHQEDSTHIAFNVVTTGLTWKMFRLEGSGFHGAEPTENRWQLEPSPNGHAIDSDSARLTFVPTPNLTAQYSIAHITSPEALQPGVNQRRQTASVMFNKPLGIHHDTRTMPGMDMTTPSKGNWSNTLLWGQTRASTTGELENSYLIESLLNLRRNYLYTRIESAARTSELLIPTPPVETTLGHVQAYTAGFDRDYRLTRHILAAPGAQFTLYRAPNALAPIYGRYPVGGVAFIRFRLAP
jgi:hypothetical protein